MEPSSYITKRYNVLFIAQYLFDDGIEEPSEYRWYSAEESKGHGDYLRGEVLVPPFISDFHENLHDC